MESKEKAISERVRNYERFLDGVCNKLLQQSGTMINNVSGKMEDREYMRESIENGLSEIVDNFLSMVRENDPEGFISLMGRRASDDFLRFILTEKDGERFIIVSEKDERTSIYSLYPSNKIKPFGETKPLERGNKIKRPSGIWRVKTETLLDGFLLEKYPELLEPRFSHTWGTAIRNSSEEYEIIEIHDKKNGITLGIEPYQIEEAVSRPFDMDFNNPFAIVGGIRTSQEDVNKYLSLPWGEKRDTHELAFDYLKKNRERILSELEEEEVIFRTDSEGGVISILWNVKGEDNKEKAILPDGREGWVSMDDILTQTRPSGGYEVSEAFSRLLDLGYYPRIVNIQ